MKRGMEMGMIGNIVCVIVLVMGIWLLVIMMIVRMSGSIGIVWGVEGASREVVLSYL